MQITQSNEVALMLSFFFTTDHGNVGYSYRKPGIRLCSCLRLDMEWRVENKNYTTGRYNTAFPEIQTFRPHLPKQVARLS